MLYVHDDAGTPMAAKFEVQALDGSISLLYDSRSGGKTGAVSRNADYMPALELIFRRLAELGAILNDAYVDSRETQAKKLTREQCRLDLPGWNYPTQLSAVDDLHVFRKKFSSAQVVIGKEKDSKGGNPTKRVRMQLEVPGFQSTSDSAERLGLILSQPQILADPESQVQGTSSGTSKEQPQGGGSGGQGFSTDPETKDAVEAAAMAAALSHYEREGWAVTDVSMKKIGYDLLCERDGDCLHVEVKGTTQPPKSVLVSPNEVSFALAHPDTATLFVWSNIVVTKREAGPPVATGGVATPLKPWPVEMDRLSPTGYNYSLDGLT